MLATSPKASLGKLAALAKPKTFKVLIVGHSGVGKTGEQHLAVINDQSGDQPKGDLDI